MTNVSLSSTHAGYTLVELLVGLAVGSIVIATAILAWSVSVGAGAYSLQTTRLNHDLRSTMQLIAADLRRADPVRFTEGDPPDADFTRSSVQIFGDEAESCVVFTVNALACEGVETPGPDCWVPRGFRLHGGEIFTLVDRTTDPVLEGIAALCDGNPAETDGWFSIYGEIDSATFAFTRFEVAPEYRCLDVDEAVINDDDLETPCADRSLPFTDWVENLRIGVNLEGSIQARGQARLLAIEDSVTVRNSVFFVE